MFAALIQVDTSVRWWFAPRHESYALASDLPSRSIASQQWRSGVESLTSLQDDYVNCWLDSASYTLSHEYGPDNRG